ncbi:MAG TPA: PP2C family protein-serine/threonine phosphatase [Blastocatellia bacterium]|nr:PP2C family protein-serine/threonine phosphatase [Blastocatellia bacterium]
MSQPTLSGLAAGIAVDLESSSVTHRKSAKGVLEQDADLKLAELRKDYADLHTALFEATQVYRRLCAPRLVRHGDFEIASETFAARHLPGDFFTMRATGKDAMLALGDISGKGFAAGMWTALLLGLLGIHNEPGAEPEAIVAAMNRDLSRASIGVPLASLFLGRLDSDNGMLDYCSAGHPPALLLRADGSLESLCEGGPLLGAVPKASYVKGTVELRDGDVLVVYSDGVLEAHNKSDEEFALDRLEAQVRRARGSSAEAILFSLLGTVQDFVGGYPQADDMSLVVARRLMHRSGVQ